MSAIVLVGFLSAGYVLHQEQRIQRLEQRR